MKIRTLLMVMAAPAGVLLGLHELGGNPLSKGFDTGFVWRTEPASDQIVLSSDPGGTVSCWIKVESPSSPSKIASATPLAQMRISHYMCEYPGKPQSETKLGSLSAPEFRRDGRSMRKRIVIRKWLVTNTVVMTMSSNGWNSRLAMPEPVSIV